MASLLMLMQFLSPDIEFWEIPVFEVNNQHILVTGGSSGLGRHLRASLRATAPRLRWRHVVPTRWRRSLRTSTNPAAERKALCSTSH